MGDCPLPRLITGGYSLRKKMAYSIGSSCHMIANRENHLHFLPEKPILSMLEHPDVQTDVCKRTSGGKHCMIFPRNYNIQCPLAHELFLSKLHTQDNFTRCFIFHVRQNNSMNRWLNVCCITIFFS